MSERELINGTWYYYLKATGKWHVYMWSSSTRMLIKLKENLSCLHEAKDYARKVDNIYKEMIENGDDRKWSGE